MTIKYIIQNVHYFLNYKLRMMHFIDNLYSSESNGKYLIYTAKILLMYELLCTINTILKKNIKKQISITSLNMIIRYKHVTIRVKINKST